MSINPSIEDAVKKGETYYWCSCGLSKAGPFCDGSHKGDEQKRKPLKYIALADQSISFCTCRKTHLSPICDGSHGKNEASDTIAEVVLKLTERIDE